MKNKNTEMELERKENTENTEMQTVTPEVTREREAFVTPLTDIYEQECGLRLVMDLPGVPQTGLTLSVDKNRLSVEGRSEYSDATYYAHREHKPAVYYREFEITNEVDVENIEAELKNGVLNVYLPFAKEVQPRVINVKF